MVLNMSVEEARRNISESCQLKELVVRCARAKGYTVKFDRKWYLQSYCGNGKWEAVKEKLLHAFLLDIGIPEAVIQRFYRIRRVRRSLEPQVLRFIADSKLSNYPIESEKVHVRGQELLKILNDPRTVDGICRVLDGVTEMLRRQ